MLERWFDRVETVEDVTEATSLPTLGYLPRDRSLRHGGRSSLIWDNPELFRMQEAVRALRTNLQFSMNSDHDLVQITSPSAGEGKSTVAANLAVAIAGVGLQTLLVDADFRAPRQHVIFDLPNDEGLSTAMAAIGEGKPLAIQPSEFKNLSVLTSGPIPPSPTEMMAARIEQTVNRLRELGSIVVIDTPPILPVSDARLVAPEVDRVLLIAPRGARNPRPCAPRSITWRWRRATSSAWCSTKSARPERGTPGTELLQPRYRAGRAGRPRLGRPSGPPSMRSERATRATPFAVLARRIRRVLCAALNAKVAVGLIAAAAIGILVFVGAEILLLGVVAVEPWSDMLHFPSASVSIPKIVGVLAVHRGCSGRGHGACSTRVTRRRSAGPLHSCS